MITSLGLPKVKTTGPITVVETVPKDRQYSNASGAFIQEFGGGSLTTHYKENTIVYTCRSKSFPGRANMCHHSRKTTDYWGNCKTAVHLNDITYPPGVHYDDYVIHLESGSFHQLAVGLALDAFGAEGINLGAAVLGANAQGYINEAARALRPDLTTVSLPNFMIEIKQITKLFAIWSKNLSLAKNLAGAHLNYKFGWKPTVGDLYAMVNSVKSLADKLAEFEKSLHKTLKGTRQILDRGLTKSGRYTPACSGGSQRLLDWSATLHQHVDAFVVWQPQQLAVLDSFTRTLFGLMDTFGVQFNPRIIWDSIPFTFVIDWFFGVGKWLETFSIDALELPIRYVDSYLQFKQTLTVSSSLSYVGNTCGFQQSGARSGGWTTTDHLFQRQPIFPDYATLQGLGWRMPTTNQFQLLLSLATVLA